MRFSIVEGEDRGDVKLYTLSSCAWCGKVKDLLNRLGVTYRFVDTDLLEEKEQDEVVEFLDSITEQWGFPVLLIHKKYMLCGYKEQATRKLLEFDETEKQEAKEAIECVAEDPDVEKAYERLRKFSEKKGYFLNPDTAFVKNLVKSLLENQGRYGYWACPCRLASGNREKDRDIICPCDYMKLDVQEFGACYCALYVSEQVTQGEMEAKTVPERRKKKGK
jgi:ferredoxin-thioredoxin reductase catalytic subunit/glutaredoxin